ncbi:MAG: hypothetical protein ABII27_09445 [bacterium]
MSCIPKSIKKINNAILFLTFSCLFIETVFAVEVNVIKRAHVLDKNPEVKKSKDYLQKEAIIKIGYDFNGKNSYSGKINELTAESPVDVKDSISLTSEYIYYIDRYFGCGFGITYQLPRQIKEGNINGKFYFFPIYFIGKIHFPGEYLTPYLQGHLGYNYLFGNGSYKNGRLLYGGLYYAGGGGIKIKEAFFLDYLFSIHEGSEIKHVDGEAFEADLEYSKMSLSIGFVF